MNKYLYIFGISYGGLFSPVQSMQSTQVRVEQSQEEQTENHTICKGVYGIPINNNQIKTRKVSKYGLTGLTFFIWTIIIGRSTKVQNLLRKVGLFPQLDKENLTEEKILESEIQSLIDCLGKIEGTDQQNPKKMSILEDNKFDTKNIDLAPASKAYRKIGLVLGHINLFLETDDTAKLEMTNNEITKLDIQKDTDISLVIKKMEAFLRQFKTLIKGSVIIKQAIREAIREAKSVVVA